MIHVSLLVFEDAILSSISGTLDILTGTNQFLLENGKPPAFRIELVGDNGRSVQLQHPARFLCQKTLAEATETDLIIVPAFNSPPDVMLEKSRPLVDWIRSMRLQGAEVASLCFGSYFLGEAGLLDGRSCTSHWMAVDDMRRRYPEARVLADAVITDEGGVYTSGGAFSSLNLLLYLVEKFCGREFAIRISKVFSVDLDRVSQAHFAVFQGQRDHDDDQIREVQTFIEENYENAFTIDDLASRSNMSRRNFIRRFKQATHNTPLEYIQRVKVEAAKRALEEGFENVTSLMYDVGYNDPRSFREVFRRFTGYTPHAYRRKYSRA